VEELKAVSERVRPMLDKALGRGRPELLYNASSHLTKAGGKMVRPYLVLKSCGAVGGDAEDALASAAAVELLHTFTLIHDDIIDHDEVRRGVPTVHTVWGVPIAIVAGDFLFAKVTSTVISYTDPARVPPARIVRVLGTISGGTIQICEGQVLDMSFPNIEDVSEEDYLLMIGKKTSYLFKVAAEVGGIVGGGSEEEVAALGRFAYNAGLAFQITDDVLGLTSSVEELGKPVGSDLRERKKTLPLIYVLNRSTAEERARIRGLLRDASSPEAVRQLREVISSAGGVEYATAKAGELLAAGLRELDRFPDGEARRALVGFARFLVEREF